MSQTEREKLLQLLNINEEHINYVYKDNKLYHNKTGVVEKSFLLHSLLTLNSGDIFIGYNKINDVVSYISKVHARNNIEFDRYEIVEKDLHLFHHDLSYVIKDAGSVILDEKDIGQIMLMEGRHGSHMATYRTNKHVTSDGALLIYRLNYIGYPKVVEVNDNDLNYDMDYTHSFDLIEEVDGKPYFLADAYLDYDFNLESKYSHDLQSTHLKDKLDIYKNGMALIVRRNETYMREKGRMRFFIDDKGELDFTCNMVINHKLSGSSAWYHIEQIIQNKEVFNSPFFLNLLASFERPLKEHFKNGEFFVDVTVNNVDDLINYRNLIGMSTI